MKHRMDLFCIGAGEENRSDGMVQCIHSSLGQGSGAFDRRGCGLVSRSEIPERRVQLRQLREEVPGTKIRK